MVVSPLSVGPGSGAGTRKRRASGQRWVLGQRMEANDGDAKSGGRERKDRKSSERRHDRRVFPDVVIETDTKRFLVEIERSTKTLKRVCRHRRPRVPLSAVPPVYRCPPGDFVAVFRPSDADRSAHVGGAASRARRSRGGGSYGSFPSRRCAAIEPRHFVAMNGLPSRTKCSQRSVSRLAMTSALSASGKTFGQSLNTRLVVITVERRYS